MSNEVMLSICIPVFNRISIFAESLLIAAEATSKHLDEVEIIVSDNASEDDIKNAVEHVMREFPGVNIVYRRNSKNLGLAGNFLTVVDMARGEYCWIVGSDDFVLSSGLDSILKVLRENPDTDFVSVRSEQVELLAKPEFVDLDEYIRDLTNCPNKWTKKRVKVRSGNRIWDELVDPVYRNVLLGSMMCGVFRKQLWNSVDKSRIKPSAKFTSIENTYPHCYIYSRCMTGRNAWYISEPCVLSGSGLRDWAGEGREGFWVSSMPLIIMKVFPELVESYGAGGLDSRQVTKAKHWAASRIGGIFFFYLLRRYILRMRVEGSELIDERLIFRSYWKSIFFYLSPFILVAKAIGRFFSKIGRKMF